MIEPRQAKAFPAEGAAVVVGASGGIGAALRAHRWM